MYMNQLKKIWDETEMTYSVIGHIFKHRIIELNNENQGTKTYHVINENGMRVKPTNTLKEALQYLKEIYSLE